MKTPFSKIFKKAIPLLNSHNILQPFGVEDDEHYSSFRDIKKLEISPEKHPNVKLKISTKEDRHHDSHWQCDFYIDNEYLFTYKLRQERCYEYRDIESIFIDKTYLTKEKGNELLNSIQAVAIFENILETLHLETPKKVKPNKIVKENNDTSTDLEKKSNLFSNALRNLMKKTSLLTKKPKP